MDDQARPCSGSQLPGERGALLKAVGLALAMLAWIRPALAGDGATEALELRYHAELAIAEERADGHAELAEAMREILPGLLLEYQATRDETIALDVVDAAFVRDQVMAVARLMEEPGLAWALDVFAGPGTGYEHGLRTAIANLADYHLVQAQRASEAALKVYEREIARQMDRLEQVEEIQRKVESKRVEATLSRASDRADLAVAQVGEPAEQAVENVAERAGENAARGVEKAGENAARGVEKAEENAARGVEKAEEKAEKTTEKTAGQAEQVVEKSAEKADKAAEHADEKMEKAAEKAAGHTEPAEQAADTADEKADKEKVDNAEKKGRGDG